MITVPKMFEFVTVFAFIGSALSVGILDDDVFGQSKTFDETSPFGQQDGQDAKDTIDFDNDGFMDDDDTDKIIRETENELKQGGAGSLVESKSSSFSHSSTSDINGDVKSSQNSGGSSNTQKTVDGQTFGTNDEYGNKFNYNVGRDEFGKKKAQWSSGAYDHRKKNENGQDYDRQGFDGSGNGRLSGTNVNALGGMAENFQQQQPNGESFVNSHNVDGMTNVKPSQKGKPTSQDNTDWDNDGFMDKNTWGDNSNNAFPGDTDGFGADADQIMEETEKELKAGGAGSIVESKSSSFSHSSTSDINGNVKSSHDSGGSSNIKGTVDGQTFGTNDEYGNKFNYNVGRDKFGKKKAQWSSGAYDHRKKNENGQDYDRNGFDGSGNGKLSGNEVDALGGMANNFEQQKPNENSFVNSHSVDGITNVKQVQHGRPKFQGGDRNDANSLGGWTNNFQESHQNDNSNNFYGMSNVNPGQPEYNDPFDVQNQRWNDVNAMGDWTNMFQQQQPNGESYDQGFNGNFDLQNQGGGLDLNTGGGGIDRNYDVFSHGNPVGQIKTESYGQDYWKKK